MNTAWAIGFAVGIAIVAVICGLAARRARKSGAFRGDYDERQQVARGKAFTAAYATLLIYLAFWMIMRSLELPFFTQSLSVLLGALISIGVFVGYSIFHDAYFKCSESPRTWLIIICASGLLNLGIGVGRLFRDATLDERLYDNANLPVGALLLVTVIFMIIKRAMDRRIEGE